ncbi:hypothetical protein [Streptomyces litchfieldiae]|uniref:Lipoprotein n=1 Tax=Streptomyces litchfieldiae TaxID=3075543 RepID=A0ABU2MUP0_9ACTN|nr:hypothetical protein [Streptomyces sp. DSM 44938]MDT0345366.1 hypothetical protein [Streptomyces sp. DSM 44938]
MRIGTRALGAATALAAVTLGGCGTSGTATPDGEDAPRPVRTAAPTPHAPEPDAALTDPSPEEDLTTPLPPPEPTTTPSTEGPPPPTDEPETTPPAPTWEGPRPEECQIGDDYWDEYLRDLCEEYMNGSQPPAR